MNKREDEARKGVHERRLPQNCTTLHLSCLGVVAIIPLHQYRIVGTGAAEGDVRQTHPKREAGGRIDAT